MGYGAWNGCFRQVWAPHLMLKPSDNKQAHLRTECELEELEVQRLKVIVESHRLLNRVHEVARQLRDGATLLAREELGR